MVINPCWWTFKGRICRKEETKHVGRDSIRRLETIAKQQNNDLNFWKFKFLFVLKKIQEFGQGSCLFSQLQIDLLGKKFEFLFSLLFIY